MAAKIHHVVFWAGLTDGNTMSDSGTVPLIHC